MKINYIMDLLFKTKQNIYKYNRYAVISSTHLKHIMSIQPGDTSNLVQT